ncbi:LolA-like protein [Ferruginibacter sp.]
MKKTVFLLLLAALCTTAFTQNKLDNILEKVIETMGGKEKLMSVKTIKKMGNGESQGVKYPVNYYAVHNLSERTDFSFNGLTGYQIITKDSGFNFSPFGGMTTPERMTAEDIKLSSDELDLEGSLLNYKAKGHTVELMENEDIDGVDAIQLRVNLKNGKTIFYFIDPDTYYIIRTTAKGVSNGQEFTNTSNYYNFKKTKEGILYAYTIDNLTFDTIEINIPLDDKLFSTKK